MSSENRSIPAPARSIREVQQSFGESLGFEQEVIWDHISSEQAEVLKLKIKTLMPDPEVPTNLTADDRKKAEQDIKKLRVLYKRTRETLFDSIWAQRKYTNRQSLTSLFYVMVALDETDHTKAYESTNWTCRPVIRARRCFPGRDDDDSSNSYNCCMIYVDESGRVYQNWTSYLAENELPDGIMVAPRHGVYTLNEQGNVQLEAWLTPAGQPNRKVLNALDNTTSVACMAAVAVPIAALVTTVAAPVAAVAAGVGLVTSAYSATRSAIQLVDRSNHEQSINITDRTARGHYFGIITSSIGLAAAGATAALRAATNMGREVGALGQFAVNGINISCIAMSFSGAGNSCLDLYMKSEDGEAITTLDIVQLSSSLFLVTHSIRNFQLASQMINDTANQRISDHRRTLSNRQRRMFNKTVKETIRTRGEIRGKMDVIRGVNEMPSPQQFNDLYKINKELNRRGIRPSFASNGEGIAFNEQVVGSTSEVRVSVQQNVGSDLLSLVTNSTPESFNGAAGAPNSNRQLFSGSMGGGSSANVESTTETTLNTYAKDVKWLMESSLCIGSIVIKMCDYGPRLFQYITDVEKFKEDLLSFARALREDVIALILEMVDTFIRVFWNMLHRRLRMYIPTETVLYKIGVIILEKYEEATTEQIRRKIDIILQDVENYFLNMNPNYEGEVTPCEICDGYFKICEL